MHNADTENILDMLSEEMEWPSADRPLLAWYMNRLGLNRFLIIWQEQSLRNETQPPRSKYRAFRARLSKALSSNSQLIL